MRDWFRRKVWYPLLQLFGKVPRAPWPVRTNFLYDNASESSLYLLSNKLSTERRKAMVWRLQQEGYRHALVYLCNHGDFAGMTVNCFAREVLSGNYNEAEIQRWHDILEALVFDDYAWPVFFIFGDDSSPIARAWRHHPGVVDGFIRRMVREFDRYAAAWVLGLELDEWAGAQHVDRYGQVLRQVTKKPVGVHQTSNRFDMMGYPWCDIGVLQYGFGHDRHTADPDHVRRMTREAKQALGAGKRVWAGEYSRYGGSARAKDCAEAAREGGATGWCNGIRI